MEKVNKRSNYLLNDPSCTPEGSHTIHQNAYDLYRYQKQHPSETLVVVGASFSWPAKIAKLIHGLNYKQLIFSGNIFSYNHEKEKFIFKNNITHKEIKAFRDHCTKIKLRPEEFKNGKITLCDMIKSGSGLISVKQLFVEWIEEVYGQNSKDAIQAFNNINLLFFQAPSAKQKYPSPSDLPEFKRSAENLIVSSQTALTERNCDNDHNRLVPQNKIDNYQELSLTQNESTTQKTDHLMLFYNNRFSILYEKHLHELLHTFHNVPTQQQEQQNSSKKISTNDWPVVKQIKNE
tara:strand:- start:395 stop:1267 length:873 start_codon:yes stop_codon:yes gene_type:complete